MGRLYAMYHNRTRKMQRGSSLVEQNPVVSSDNVDETDELGSSICGRLKMIDACNDPELTKKLWVDTINYRRKFISQPRINIVNVIAEWPALNSPIGNQLVIYFYFTKFNLHRLIDIIFLD